MRSSLKSKNGTYLKKFLLEKFQILYVISPPRIFFKGFDVSVCIVIGTRNDESLNNFVKFVRILDREFFTSDFKELTTTLSNPSHVHVESVNQQQLDEKEDWIKYLTQEPKFYSIFSKSKKFSKLGKLFHDIRRGGLASEGNGRGFFFPWSYREILKNEEGKNIVSKINKQFKKLGLNNSDIPRHYILTNEDLQIQMSLAVKKQDNISKYPHLQKFVEYYKSNYQLPKSWRINKFPNRCNIIIPRASRRTHIIFLNPFYEKYDVYFSSNFICLSDFSLIYKQFTQSQIVKYIVAFLNSSFGQIIFEKESQNYEGLRKVEKYMIEQMVIPTDISSLKNNVIEIINEFENLKFGNTGLEGDDNLNPRYKLDLSIAKLLFQMEDEFRKLFDSPKEFAKYSEYILSEIVRDRKGI